ncbi:hypothetical protein ACFSTI_21255 [Rhizorhabdus histidinilytica]
MDSSITPHLACPRSRPRRIADDYAPPYPAWSARIDPAIGQVVMASYGVQWRGPGDADAALAHVGALRATLDAASGAAMSTSPAMSTRPATTRWSSSPIGPIPPFSAAGKAAPTSPLS